MFPNNVDPNMVQALMNNPEIAQLMQRPDVMQRLMEVSQNPSRAMELMSDPELAPLFTHMMGAMGGSSGMDGLTGASGTSSSKVKEVLNLASLRNTLSEAQTAGLPVVIDFSASWCGPCKRIAPLYEELARSYAGRMVFVKVDGDRNREAVEEYQVSGYPTFLFFQAGTQLLHETFSGADGDRLRSTVSRVVEDAEERRARARQPTYKHFPIREQERVLYRGVAWPKVAEHIRGVCVEHPALCAPGLDAAGMVDAVTTLGPLLTDAMFSMSPLGAEQLAFLRTLLTWPEAYYSSTLHVLRAAALHSEAAKAIAGPALEVDGRPALLVVAERVSLSERPLVATLALRLFANCCAKTVLERHALSHAAALVECVNTLMLSHSEDKHVLASGLACLLNLVLAAGNHAGRAGAPSVDAVTALLVGSAADVTSLLVEVAPAETMRECVYKALVLVGSCLVIAHAQGGVGPQLRAVLESSQLSRVAREWAAAAGTAQAQEAAAEVCQACTLE